MYLCVLDSIIIPCGTDVESGYNYTLIEKQKDLVCYNQVKKERSTMQDSIKIPTFTESKESIENGTATPLDRLVYNYEPNSGGTFRRILRDVLEDVVDATVMLVGTSGCENDNQLIGLGQGKKKLKRRIPLEKIERMSKTELYELRERLSAEIQQISSQLTETKDKPRTAKQKQWFNKSIGAIKRRRVTNQHIQLIIEGRYFAKELREKSAYLGVLIDVLRSDVGREDSSRILREAKNKLELSRQAGPAGSKRKNKKR